MQIYFDVANLLIIMLSHLYKDTKMFIVLKDCKLPNGPSVVMLNYYTSFL